MSRSEIIEIIRNADRYYHRELDKLKDGAEAIAESEDWPWNAIVMSAATRGGSWRWEKKVEPIYQAELSWGALKASVDRESALLKVGRYRNRTAASLNAIYSSLAQLGGPAQVREKMRRMAAEDIIVFLTGFPGVGDKYARNIMMDVYDPRFRDRYFAIDSRLQPLLGKLGCSKVNYAEQEEFLCRLAEDAGIECWRLDRLLYNFAPDLDRKLDLVDTRAL